MPVPPLPLWLDCSLPLSKGVMTPAQAGIAAAEFRRVCRDLPVAVVTDLPRDLMPGTYVSCRVLTTPVVPWESEAGGVSPVHLALWADYGNHCWCYAGWNGDPLTLGRAAAHEAAGHMLAPPGWPHSPSGVFASPPSGVDFTADDVRLRRQWVPDLVAGWRQPGGDRVKLNRADPNWPLPVFAAGQLIFEAGPPLALESVPRGWRAKDWDGQAGGKTVLDFGARVAHVAPGRAGAAESPGAAVVFTPGPVCFPEWGPAPGWRNRPGSAALTGGKVVVSPAEMLTYLP